MADRLWLIPIGGALLAPLVTWLPMLAHRFPWLGLPPYDVRSGAPIDIMHMGAFWLVVFALLGAVIGQRDRWLGVTVFVLGGDIFLWGGAFDITHRLVFLGGAVALWAIRFAPRAHVPLIRSCLAASGIFQAVYMLQQWFGYDVLWSPIWWGVLMPPSPNFRMLGTLGTVDAASAYVAITAPLMPVWALPLALAVVLLGHSIGAMLALAVGLLVAYHRNWTLTAWAIAGVAALFLYGFHAIQQWHVPSTVSARWDIWKLALADWWHTYPIPVQGAFFGYANPVTGNGEWYPRVAYLQRLFNVLPTNEQFREAHNEYIQWAYTHGLLGASLLGLWLWEHRRMFRDVTVGASLCALAVVSASFFTFQVVSVALLGLVLIGLGTAYSPQEVA